MTFPCSWKKVLLALVVAVGVARAAADKTVLVKKIYSGNSIKIQEGDTQQRVRYIGTDAPNRGKPFYDLCSQANKALVEKKKVTLVTDVELVSPDDKKLYYVYEGSVFVNAELIRTGYALAHIIPPNVRYRDLFISLQQEARTHQRGLWAYEDHNDEPYYVGSQSLRVFHRPSCSHVRSIPFHDRIIFRTRDDALREGYTQDWRCSPLFVKPTESAP